MKNFIVYNNYGKILRTGFCSSHDYKFQAKSGEKIMEGTASDYYHKIIDGGVIDKTQEEIDIDNPTPISVPFDDQQVMITNKEYNSILERLDKLEKI